jgi:hypothetical protein
MIGVEVVAGTEASEQIKTLLGSFSISETGIDISHMSKAPSALVLKTDAKTLFNRYSARLEKLGGVVLVDFKAREKRINMGLVAMLIIILEVIV